jgi:hypothetical protein
MFSATPQKAGHGGLIKGLYRKTKYGINMVKIYPAFKEFPAMKLKTSLRDINL